MEDIYSYAVNTIDISIECNEKSVFSRVRSTSENLNVFITRDENFYGIHRKRENFLFILLFTHQCALLMS